jgi:transcriptional regulator with GAF, ATPase, and Fis domain
MAHLDQNDYVFFREAMLSITSSLDLSKAMIATFGFLKQYYPLKALSLHTMKPDFGGLHLAFLVVDNQFFFLDGIVPLPPSEIERLKQLDQLGRISYVPHSVLGEVTRRHSEAISQFVPYKDRSYLASTLSQGNSITRRHFVLIGKTAECFTPAHERMFLVLRPAISLVMSNLLQHREVIDLQHRLDEQRLQLVREVNLLRNTSIIGANAGLKKTMDVVAQLAGKESPVLIQGETGTGKELIADTIQSISRRANGPFIKVNCGAIPESLVDSELFGFQKGAFTGAFMNRPGKFEEADGGTLFLDEVGDLPPQVQVRLLRVLQNKVVDRLGSSKPIAVDVRIIAATNRPLESMVQNGGFREDLFYRLNVFPIHIPPLRERSQDIPNLIYHFLLKTCKSLKLSSVPRLSPESMEKLMVYSWPGNVRELGNLLERALTINPEDPLELDRYLPKDFSRGETWTKKDSALQTIVREQVREVLKEILPDQIKRKPTDDASSGINCLAPLDTVIASFDNLKLTPKRAKR